jgi:acyl-CoA hydrolase
MLAGDHMARRRNRVSDSKTTVARVMMPQDATILKMVDEVAYVAATKHARTNVVTASVDRMAFLSPVRVGDLVTLKANLNAVWHTSMEVGVRVEAENPRTGETRHTGSSYLTLVALGEDGRPTPVRDLILETVEDHRRNREAMRRRARRLEEKAVEGFGAKRKRA